MIMNVSDQVQLKFHGVSFPAVNFNSHAPFLHEDGSKININIDPKLFYTKDKSDYFRIIQEIYLYSEGYFDLNIVAIGTFEIRGTIDEGKKQSFLNLNAPAIMFPYIRSFITTLTANLGDVTGTLTIPTQFFKGELKEVDSIEEEE